MDNASSAVNARVSHWIEQLSRFTADVESAVAMESGDVPSIEHNSHHNEYEVRRDPEESWTDPEPGHAGIEIRIQSTQETVLLGLCCDNGATTEQEDRDLLADYVLKDQTALAEQGNQLRCFLTNRLDQIRFFVIQFERDHSTETSARDYNMELEHDSDSLQLSGDEEAIKNHLKDAILKNRDVLDSSSPSR